MGIAGKFFLTLFFFMGIIHNSMNAQVFKNPGKYIGSGGKVIDTNKVKDVGQDAIDVVRGEKKPEIIVKKWYEESRDELEKVVGGSIEISGDVLRFVGEEGTNLIEFSEGVTKDFIRVSDKLAEIAPEIVDIVTPDGEWRVDLVIFEVKSHKSIDERMRQYKNELKEELINVTSLTSEILKGAASGVEYTGIFLEYFAEYLAASAEGFPTPYDNSVSDLDTADLVLSLSNKYLNVLLGTLVKEAFYYGEEDKEYIKIDGFDLVFDEGNNSMLLKAKNGTVGFDIGAVRGAFKIKEATLQLIPKIINKDDKLFFEFGVRLINLDIKDVPPRLDKLIAFGIQDNLFNKPIVVQSLSEQINFSFESRIRGRQITKKDFESQRRKIEFNSKSAIVLIDANNIFVKVNYHE